MTAPTDSQELRFLSYMEGTMTDAERESFESEIESDDSLLNAFLEFQEQDLPPLGAVESTPAPTDFTDRVRGRIRRRSRGRYFSDKAFHQRFQVELLAAIALVMLGAVFLIANPEKITNLVSLDPALTESHDEGEVPDPAVAPSEEPEDDSEDTESEEVEGESQLEPPPEDPYLGVMAVRDAREGSVSGAPILGTARQDYQYTVTIEGMDADELDLRLRRQFGGDDVEPAEGEAAYEIWFDAEDVVEGVQQLSELGTVERELITVPHGRDRVFVRVIRQP